MSRPQQDADNPRQRSQRPRANTSFTHNSFASFAPWRKQKQDSPPQSSSSQSLPLHELLEALTPPVVPSVSHARALTSMLASLSPPPRPDQLNPIIASMCSVDAPLAIQAAGFDLMAAYFENHEAPILTTADRMVYFSFFINPSVPWTVEIWEPRFKAIRALTKWGEDLTGIESNLVTVLKTWILAAYKGLLPSTEVFDRAEITERERSIDILSGFLTAAVESPDVAARLRAGESSSVLSFFAGLVEQALEIFVDKQSNHSLLPSPISETSGTPPHRPLHRRHPSSISLASSSTLAIPPKQPIDIAVTLYIQHFKSRAKFLTWTCLDSALPLLFRIISHYASPLPRLTVLSNSKKPPSMEDKVSEILSGLLSGPYSSSCIALVRQNMQPPQEPCENIGIHMQISCGAARTLRHHIRGKLASSLARAYIQKESSYGYSHSGAPAHADMEHDLFERAWPKDNSGGNKLGWEASRLGRILYISMEAWASYHLGMEVMESRARKERILDEAAGVLKDVLQEFDEREDPSESLAEEEAIAVGRTLRSLCSYVLTLKSDDGAPLQIPLSEPSIAPSPFLRSLSSLLSRDHTTPMIPSLSATLLYISDHLTDQDIAKLPLLMLNQHDLSPTDPDWLDNWQHLLGNPSMNKRARPLTHKAVMSSLDRIYYSVKDMPTYRRPLSDFVLEFCSKQLQDSSNSDEGYDVTWSIVGQEVVLRSVEAKEQERDDPSVDRYISFFEKSLERLEDEDEDEDDRLSVNTNDPVSPPSGITALSTTSSHFGSPVLSRLHSDFQGQTREPALPSVMSLLSSITANPVPPVTSPLSPPSPDTKPATPVISSSPQLHKTSGPVVALITIFCQVAFSPLSESNIDLVHRVHRIFTNLLTHCSVAKVKLTILKFMMHLRADRDHCIYYVDTGFDADGHIKSLATLINRTREQDRDVLNEKVDAVRTRDRMQRDGRKTSRGRGRKPSTSRQSRSRSRAPARVVLPGKQPRPRESLWSFPDTVFFTVPQSDIPSPALISYNPDGPGSGLVMQISDYLDAIVSIIEKEYNWEVLSYVLCHLPTQLANKHLFCGPKSRQSVVSLMTTLCAAIVNDDFSMRIDQWPPGLKGRDASGLAYHTLTVLISYKRCFDMRQRHLLVDLFQAGLDGQASTTKCCLHALALAAFDLEPSVTKYLSQILEKLSQIMSNPEMAVHILGFIGVVGSNPPLYANFTDADYKMVFGVALQYLQHHNRMGRSPTIPWALSQYVRVISYYIVYVWFLAIKLADRPRHIQYIVRQVLIANEGNATIDEPSEVCFDWLARYAYASADPRPAHSILNDIVMRPASDDLREIPTTEKTWILGNSVVTIRSLPRLGWVEVISRRPSGLTKFLCRLENVPLVGPGDVNPDMLSGIASLVMDRAPASISLSNEEDYGGNDDDYVALSKQDDSPQNVQDPNPITGYVWSGSAPSQRRKGVAVDPSFFALQLSSYPDRLSPRQAQMLVPPEKVPAFIRTLDRAPVIDTHKVGVMYVAPGQSDEIDILRNTHGSPAYTRFLEGLGRLINLRGQMDVYAGGLDPDEDGEYAYAWWDDIGQVLYHTATMMPTKLHDPQCNNKKRHLGNDYVRIVWNDSGAPYRFDTLSTQFQFVNIVIEPHSFGTIAAFSSNVHENEYFKIIIQRVPGMAEFTPIGCFKLISAQNLPLLIRQLALLSDWHASVFQHTQRDTEQVEFTTNWQHRLQAIRRFKQQQLVTIPPKSTDGAVDQEAFRDFSTSF